MPEQMRSAPTVAFEEDPAPQSLPEDGALVISVDGFEGPLDLLLTMARTQKLDLQRISVLQLAEQYLGFISAAQTLRIELAADYLVMAAWLAYLKSRLLLPKDEDEAGPTGDELAAHLAFQLERLEAMRRAAAELMARDQLGRDFFTRGMTETVTVRRQVEWTATLADLLKAYARVKTREEYRPLQIDRSALFAIEQALVQLRSVIGKTSEWGRLSTFLPEGWRLDPKKRRSAVASTFAASLELAKQGEVELRQESTFAPVYIRRRVSETERSGELAEAGA